MIWNELDISEDTRRMLNELVKRKKEMERLRWFKNGSAAFTAGIGLYLTYAFYRATGPSVRVDIWGMLPAMIAGDGLMLLCLFLGSFLIMNDAMKKFTKQKNKFEALRLETIDNLQSTWTKSRNAGQRDRISREAKEKHDINLAYKG